MKRRTATGWHAWMLLAFAFALQLPLLACGGVSVLGTGNGDGGKADRRVDAPAIDVRDSGTGLDAGQVCLVALNVTTAASPSQTLVPPFSPTTYDYYIRCAAGVNALTVSMTACPGADSELVQPKASASAPKQTVSVSVTENQAVVAAATRGGPSVEYWVRCLPHDFPIIETQAHASAGTPTPGYYLVGTANPPPSVAGYAMVLDGNGVPVWYRRQPSGGVYDVDSLMKGSISFFATGAAPELLTLGSTGAKTISAAGVTLSDEELRLLPNGNYVALSSPTVTGVDLTGLSIPLPDGGVDDLGPNSKILDCNIVEFEPTGAIVWTWIASDHFDPVKDCTSPIFATGGTVDAFHCNSIDVDPSNGNLLVSARQMDSVFYIERSTGKVLWKMGGSVSSKDNAVYVPVADPFYGQHDARLQPGWSSCAGGQMSIFDDETGRSNPRRAVVYDVARVGGGCDSGTAEATVAWQYKGSAATAGGGSFRILPDGSRTVGWGLDAPGLVFSEVDVAGHDLLDFSFPSMGSSDRAIKVPLATFDLAQLRAGAGQ